MTRRATTLAVFLLAPCLVAQTQKGSTDKFRQLEELLPTPNSYRTASGAPGHQYWQQKVDYVISVELDDEKQRITGTEQITYKNNSPDTLTYLWLQLDQNIWAQDSITTATSTAPRDMSRLPFRTLEMLTFLPSFQGGYRIKSVKNRGGDSMRYTIQNTMMRVDLPIELPPGGTAVFSIDWEYNINPSKRTATGSTASPSGSRAWRPTPTSTAGNISSFSAPANSRWSLAITRSGSLFPMITSSPRRALCRIRKRFFRPRRSNG
jgi:hypothetical protein